MSTSPGTANRQIARAAGTVMAAALLSNVTGLIRQILVSRTFGTGREIDAFSAASTFPDLLFSLVAGGALASAFVPTVTGFLAREDRQGAWQLSSAILNLVLLVTAVLSLLSVVIAPYIVAHFLAPDFDPAKQALTAALLRILLVTPVIFAVSGLMMGLLNAHQVFLWPALAPTMYWLGMIGGLLFLAPKIGIYGLAWGAVAGAVLHLVVQLPALLRQGGRYFPTLGLYQPAVREVGRLMAPRLLGVAAVQINFVVNTILASGQPEGSLAAIKYAWMVMTMPQVVIAQAIAIAALPTFSAQFARGELSGLRLSLAATLRGVVLLSLPASLGLILLREPVVALLFQRGRFDEQSTSLVAWALLWYAAGLVGHSVVEITSRAFYALHDTRTPVLVGVGAMALNLVFSIAFSALFAAWGWMPHGGLALANSLATALEMGGLMFLMRRRLAGLEGRHLGMGAFQAALASLVMAIVLWVWLSLAAEQPAWVVAGGGVVLGAGAFGLAALLLGVREVKEVAGAARRWRATNR